VCAITLYTGSFFISGASSFLDDVISMEWIFLFIILLPNLVFFSFWFVHMYIEILKIMVNTQRRKAFSVLACGCISVEKFMQNHMMVSNSVHPVLVDLKKEKDEKNDFTNIMDV
jgi:hypothetical protein